MAAARRIARIAVLLGLATPAVGRAQEPVLDAMKVELARSLESLRRQPTPPYFLSYDITEVHQLRLSSSFGAITERRNARRRALDVELRVGDYTFDNTHARRGRFPDFSRLFAGPVELPLDDDPMAIRAALWRETEQRYRAAVEQLSRVRTNVELQVAPEDSSPDFSRESPERFTEPVQRLGLDRAAWEDRIRRYTAPFARHPSIYGAMATLQASVETHWYVNSEGSELQTSQPVYRLIIAAYSKADDGMELPRYESFFAATPDGLPDERAVLQAVDRMIVDLEALRNAPIIDPYTGPAILSGRASAVFFHEILGHRLEGHRQKDEDEGQTFTRQLTEAILPPGFSVYFDPTLRELGGVTLAGHYRYDAEGVRARRVAVIERGRLKTFLMSRSPIEGFASSNGHGRRQVGFAPVARQSNLIVQVDAPRTRAQLKALLLDQIRRQRKPFGLLFDDIEGGFTITMRDFPNAFEVLPVMVYRVFPDGREELVRGVDLIGTPLTVFSQVATGDDQIEVFNGLCGAESGLVPVSAASPAVLITQIEVQKKGKSSARAPILPAPAAAGASDTGDVVLRAMRDELARSMAELRLDTMPRPYFIAYRVDETTTLRASATGGSLTGSDEDRDRQLTVELRVGDYAFDNTNFLGVPSHFEGMMGAFSDYGELPLDDSYTELRRHMWLATDDAYKNAVDVLARKRAAIANRVRRDDIPDFSREEAVTTTDVIPVPPLDRAAAEALVRDVSAVFRDAPEIYESSVTLVGSVVRTWYVNSEGTSFTRVSPVASVHASAGTQTADGMPLDDGIAASAPTPAGLPSREALLRGARDLAARLTALRTSRPAETYNGPVLFEGRAAAELFASMFAPQLLARRAPLLDNPMFDRMRSMDDEGGVDRIGSRVLPRTFSVTDNPTLRAYDGKPIGGFAVDDDGVRTRETKLVQRGILQTLLTTRVPVRGLTRSTGNRRGPSGTAVIGNLFVTSDSGLSDRDLRRRAFAVARANGKAAGDPIIVVRRLGWAPTSRGGFRGMMARIAAGGGPDGPRLPVAEAVRLHPDGREEPLRGVLLGGLSSGAFKEIVAASRSRAAVTLSPGGGSAMAMFIPPEFAPFMRSQFGHATTFVVPSLLFEELAVRGDAGDGLRPPITAPPWLPGR